MTTSPTSPPAQGAHAETPPRTFAPNRYRKGDQLFLDSNTDTIREYHNSYQVYDRDNPTGVVVSETGAAAIPGSNKRRVTFGGKEYPSIREAIFAYEDSIPCP